jgi:hypothetical protein
MRASDNSALKSAGFEEKKPIFAQSPYSLTAEIAKHDDWTPAAIEDRQTSLARLTVQAWPLG